MSYTKPFLKWPGGKFRLLERINDKLDSGRRFVEPFVGSGAVFLNTNYRKYLLADTNPDLINLYLQVQNNKNSFIDYCKSFFIEKNNNEARYYKFRKKFNTTTDVRLKSALFLYLNRHCYNGLCRYNSRHEFNTPFGRYKKPYFPKKEIENFHRASQSAKFIHSSFIDTMKKTKKGDVVYCDPPYVPLSKTACFTDYFSGGFGWDEQIQLAEWAGKLAKKGIPVIISNHDTDNTRNLYHDAGAKTEGFLVRRTISCNVNNRKKIGEILAVFQPA
ncbi:MAG TPA: Dam family site-specific DNA-(adenine-N6)-methyltransferase [Thiotrichaceae bacterium]|nr:Dam family site-specific DNA-(adenine-N6)-methyltransferase [Thiotrichaceae bacterium]HIM07799.1 Dam family site-specific DNA-(adenine-N6)-methyltransferase [Gammaproteobacteria bacterium]